MYCTYTLNVHVHVPDQYFHHKVRVENVKEPSEHIPAVLDRVRPEYLRRTYQVSSWNDFTDFLEKVAAKSGKLLKVRLKNLIHCMYIKPTINCNH